MERSRSDLSLISALFCFWSELDRTSVWLLGDQNMALARECSGSAYLPPPEIKVTSTCPNAWLSS